MAATSAPLPSRTSILVAAARAFGSREPDESVRNPDSLAAKLIGPSELALIGDHPISGALDQDYNEAMQNPAIVGFAWLMLARTRFIDESLHRAVQNGATQVVILGAGFDSRAYRFRHLLRHCLVIEVDSASTQQYKRQRIEAALPGETHNVIYSPLDFAKGDLIAMLRDAGFRSTERTLYICEGVCMYLPEEIVRAMLHSIATHTAPGSSLVLDYPSRLGLEFSKLNAGGPGGIPPSWNEPWLFGVTDNGVEFFRELGFDPGVPLALTNPELARRYTISSNGTSYGASAFEKMRELAQGRLAPVQAHAAQLRQAMADAGGAYWLLELTVPD